MDGSDIIVVLFFRSLSVFEVLFTNLSCVHEKNCRLIIYGLRLVYLILSKLLLYVR